MFVISTINPFKLWVGDKVYNSSCLIVTGENKDGSVNVGGVIIGLNTVEKFDRSVTLVIPPGNATLVQTNVELPDWFTKD